ncbi:MAG TPA: PAS domain S-box protein [Candidatus Limnocylindrales bacterium]
MYSLLEVSPNAIVEVDARGLITYVNERTERLFGYRRDELLGLPVETLLPERVRDRHLRQRNGFLAHPIARPMEVALDLVARTKDGREIPVEISLSPVTTGDGLRVVATVVDITSRKAAESALADSERRFRAVLEASPNAVLAIDRDGRITYVNPALEATFGYPREDLLGRAVEMLLPEPLRERHVGHRSTFLHRPVARPMGIGLDLAGRRQDGVEIPVEISLAPVEVGGAVQVFATIVDITARRAAATQLLEAQKLESVGRLAGGIAHDFNNMLFAIRGYTDLLEADLRDASTTAPLVVDEAVRSVEAIRDAADRAASLTSQLLAFSRRQVVSPTVLDLNAAIATVEPMLRALIGENVHLTARLDPAIGRIRVDASQLDQILVNLVVNARDAMPDGGTVTIETGSVMFDEPYAMEHFDVEPGPYVQLSVSDSGHGMDRETREHVFEPFFTTKESGKGTGLGLATIHGIVRQAGGHIWLYSEPGQGSTFKLYFPLVDADISAKPAPVTTIPSAGSGMVLLVEDDPVVRDMTTRLLERTGYDVVTVGDGSEAIAWLASAPAPPDVLVSDVVMPNMSGVELAERVMGEYPSIGVVLLSGYTPDRLNIDRVVARGAQFVPKPVTSRTFLDAVARAHVAGAEAPS